jgi:tetratricopeptide (TPR) repeat protein
MTGRVLPFPRRAFCSAEGRAAARRILATPAAERLSGAGKLPLQDPEALLSICAALREQIDTSPGKVQEEAEFFYRFVETPGREVGLFDERDYFLGELALLAGTACRHLSRWDEAWLWFDRSEAGFRHTVNATAELSRLAYQRLALRLEARQLDAVLEMVPPLMESFRKLEMSEDVLKCRFLEGLALMESGRLEEATDVFRKVVGEAGELRSDKLLALAYTNLTQIHGILGETDEALNASQLAIPILRRLDDRIGLAKVQWGIANLLRKQGQIESAVEAYRSAQREFGQIGMRADVAALSLVVADLLLERGQDPEAMREVLAALPVLDELKMVPEGVAARSLLRESLRNQKINRQALRDLHGYFEEIRK